MSEQDQDREHHATPLRRKKARAEGDFVKSFELAVALQVIGAGLALWLFSAEVGQSLNSVAHQWWHYDSELSLSSEAVSESLVKTAWSTAVAVLPLLCCFTIVVIASHWLQTGMVWIPSKAAPDPGRIGPSNMTRQMFSLHNFVTLFSGIPKFAVAVAVAMVSIGSRWESVLGLMYQPVDRMTHGIVDILTVLTFHVGMVLLAISVLDYWVRWISFERRIAMSDKELREEARAQDGDPVINSQRSTTRQRYASGETMTVRVPSVSD